MPTPPAITPLAPQPWPAAVDEHGGAHEGPLRAGRPPRSGVARIAAAALFAGAQEVEIQFGEAVYRLRITSLGKLILTK